ncbi:MAG: hypothetical protein ACRCZF_06630, partial [Gemmataceae bacterium]
MTAKRIWTLVLCAQGLSGLAWGQSAPMSTAKAFPAPPIPDSVNVPGQLPLGTPGHATDTLTHAPGITSTVPPGAVASPWVGATPAGQGSSPNGPITYELVMFSG